MSYPRIFSCCPPCLFKGLTGLRGFLVSFVRLPRAQGWLINLSRSSASITVVIPRSSLYIRSFCRKAHKTFLR